jgi:hypothetical protein
MARCPRISLRFYPRNDKEDLFALGYLARTRIGERQTTMRCTLTGLAAAVWLIFTPLLSDAVAETPLVPLISDLHHWDHHWYIWLPGDPVYEAVEVMAAKRGPDTAPLVWVFFTERDGFKRQIHYYNDPRLAAATGAQLRDIAFTMSGSDGGPRDVSVSLLDQTGRPVEIAVSFSPDARLITAGAGLTNQIGHSGDRMLLMFFRERNAFAQTWHVMIAGIDASIPQSGQNRSAPFPAAYSSNIFVGLFPFGDRSASFEDARPGEEKGVMHFTPTAVVGVYSATRPDRTRIELATEQDAALQYYRHHNGPHVLEVSFEPPLPSPGRLTAAFNSTYRISLDGFHDLLTGSVHASRKDDAIILDWEFNSPDWTRARPLRTKAILKDGSIASVELRPNPVAN